MRTQVSFHVPIILQFSVKLECKRSKISRKTQVSMALFLSTDIHQGDERFSILSRGNQCAFIYKETKCT